MTDLTNPNTERFRKTPSDESVEGCLGASSAGQGEVTPSALAPTQPLDLIADLKELSAGHHSQANVLVWNVSLSALIARVEQLDGDRDHWRSEIGRLTREHDEWESNATEESARAEAAEANHQKAERKANDLFDEGIRQKNRAIAAEKKVKAARKLVDTCSLYGMVPCDDLDKALDGAA